MAPTKLVTAPIRFGFQATRTTVGLSVKVAGRVAGGLIDLVQHDLFFPKRDGRSPGAPEAGARPATSPSSTTTGSMSDVQDADTQVTEAEVIPITAAETIAPDELPDTPLSEAEAAAKTVDDADVLVGEFAGPGAEDGAGAQIQFDEPWAGYGTANAGDITKRLADADAALIAVVELYEQANKGRKTVLDAAAKRLRELSATQ